MSHFIPSLTNQRHAKKKSILSWSIAFIAMSTLLTGCTSTIDNSPSEPSSLQSTPSPEVTEQSQKKSHNVDCSVEKCVALTFDDGPDPVHDIRLLGILSEHHASATFFVIGNKVKSFPEIVQKIHDEGHEIGSHSFSHLNLTKLSSDKVKKEIKMTQQAVFDVTGEEPCLIRPPYGAFNNKVDDIITQQGLEKALWNLDTLDWKSHSPEKILHHIKMNAHRNSVILMHDIHSTSIDAVEPTITWLQSQGYTLVTVSDLYDDKDTAGNKAATEHSGLNNQSTDVQDGFTMNPIPSPPLTS